VKWQGVPERRCALGRFTVKAKTKDKVFARARERGLGTPQHPVTVHRRPRPLTEAYFDATVKGRGGVMERNGHRLYTGCIRPPSDRANPIAELYHFV
jgi:hypothetical protein